MEEVFAGILEQIRHHGFGDICLVLLILQFYIQLKMSWRQMGEQYQVRELKDNLNMKHQENVDLLKTLNRHLQEHHTHGEQKNANEWPGRHRP